MLAPELRPWIASTGQDGSRYSMQEFAGDGARTSFEFNFAGGYIDPANVRAYIYDAETEAQTPVSPVVLTGPNTISVVPAIPGGSFLVVYRDTEKGSPLVDFADGAVMSEDNLDLVARQAVLATAEMVDRFYVTEQTVGELTAEAQAATARSEQALATAAEAQSLAASAVETAGQALAGVTGAEEAAVAATAAAQVATAAADNANQTAADVRELAEQAVDQADAAVATANGVDGKAQSALDAATQAAQDAAAAVATANGVDGKAQDALDSASAAAEVAAGAQQAAYDAAEAAQSAATEAGVAQQGVEEAKTLAAQNAVPVTSVSWWHYRPSIQAGDIPGDGQIISRATYPDVTQAVLAGLVPVVTESEWLADPLKRGAYTLGDGETTIRIPDYNGMSPGSVGAVVLRGDGAMSAGMDGVIQRDALQNITGTFTSRMFRKDQNIGETGAFYSNTAAGTTTGGGAGEGNPLAYIFDASRVARTAGETRATNVTGCFVIKAFGAVLNPGSVDAAQLASDLAAVAASVSTLQGQMSQVYGVAQTLQDVSGSRTPGTTYVNATGRPIHVYASATVTAAGGGLRILVDSKSASYSQQSSVGSVSAVSTSIPAGASYQILTASVNAASIVCLEYR